MAVYILLQFDNDREAYTFATDHFANPDHAHLTPLQENEVRPKIWGIWRKPDKFCNCTKGRGKPTLSGFTRGKVYGWWVCSTCKNPTARWASGRQWFTILGSNLLPRSLRPYPEEMPGSLESPAVWSDLGQTIDIETL